MAGVSWDLLHPAEMGSKRAAVQRLEKRTIGGHQLPSERHGKGKVQAVVQTSFGVRGELESRSKQQLVRMPLQWEAVEFSQGSVSNVWCDFPAANLFAECVPTSSVKKAGTWRRYSMLRSRHAASL